jgi:type IV pilus assembly protein PilV
MYKNTSVRRRAHVKWRGARGLTLIETLVALVIMSVGLLGIAALHVESVKAARSATLRTKAITLAVDMAEKMRANRVGTLAGDYTIGPGDMGSNHNCADDIDGAATVACNPAEMADHDVWLWKQRLGNAQSGLPEGATGEIDTDGATDPTFTITLAWEENDAEQAIELQVQP